MIRTGGILLSIFLVVACATGPRVTKTYEANDLDDAVVGKLLVVGVASNYTRRAEFERVVASRLNEQGLWAVAYHTLVPENDSLTQESVTDSIESGGFDSLLLTRIVSQDTNVSQRSGSSTVAVTRRDDRAFDFFRYDYDILTDPDVISVRREGTLLTEMYLVRDERMIWAIETAASVEANVSETVEQIADAITDQLERDGLVGR